MIYFVDCEASSLHSASYPIEIAWVDENGQGESYLLKPEADWTDWSVAAQTIHGIDRASLQEGAPAPWIARRALSVLGGHVLVSDNPDFEQKWVGTLLATIGHPPLPFTPLATLISEQVHRMQQLITAEPDSADWHRQSRRLLDHGQVLAESARFMAVVAARVRHRALPDAETQWRVWRDIKARIDLEI